MPNTALFTILFLALDYPPTRKGDVVETIHGVEIADPYRWLEDADSPETKAWVQSQVKFTNAWFAKLEGRDKIARLTQLMERTTLGIPVKRGGRYFYTQRDPGQAQASLYVREDWAKPARLLIDAATLSKDGTTSIANWSPSRDGKFVAWSVSVAGSDRRLSRVREAETGTDLPDKIEWMKVSGVTWAADSAGFYYDRFPEVPAAELLRAKLPQAAHAAVRGSPDSRKAGPTGMALWRLGVAKRALAAARYMAKLAG
jgi:prolyl oligopeptidase